MCRKDMFNWLEFKTSEGNNYFWDGKVGLIFPSSPIMNLVLKEIGDHPSLPKGEIINRLNKLDDQEVAYCYDYIKKYGEFREGNDYLINHEFPPENIKKYLFKFGLQQLTLNVTEDCNFRCKYCVFSGKYADMRTHSKKYMDFSIAKKAIDHYFSLLYEGKRYNPLRSPSIAFYGGEPLLNFKLIVECVKYIKNTYTPPKITYSMTTNGSLLNEDIADWLMQNNFNISVSLDGPEDEHNRNRAYANGKGTYEDVIKNISYMMDRGYSNITSLPVYDWKSDLFRLECYFNKDEVPPIANVSLVTYNESYYQQFSSEDIIKYHKQEELAKDYYFKNYGRISPNKSVFHHLFGNSAARAIFDTIPTSSSNPLLPFTGTCMPGRKIFVDIDGTFHMCQVINYFFPIGTAVTGLDFELISRRLKEYFQHTDMCSSCKIKKRCAYCYANLVSGNEIYHTSNICKNIEKKVSDSLKLALSIAELNPDTLEQNESYLVNYRRNY